MTDDRTLLFNTLRALSDGCGRILAECKTEKEMRAQASEMLTIANRALLAEPSKPIIHAMAPIHIGDFW